MSKREKETVANVLARSVGSAGAQSPAGGVRYVTIRVPVAIDATEFAVTQVSVRMPHSRPRQSHALRDLFAGLRRIHAEIGTGNGRVHVDSQARAVQWLLDAIATETEG